MKKILIPFAIICGLVLAGCSQDRLDIPQKGVIAMDDFYQTDEDAEQALVAAYEAIASNYMTPRYNDNWVVSLWNYLGDDMYAAGNNKTDNIGQNELNSFRYLTTNGIMGSAYRGLYTAIYSANLAIDHFKDGLPEKGPTATTQRVVAEAKVLRALSYLYLALGWGTPPIVDHVVDPTEEKPGNAASQAEVLDFIIKDCNDAMPYLDDRKGPNDKNGAVKVTKGLANTIKGKALVWKGDYAGAQDALAQVINSGNYALVPSEQLEDCFHLKGDGNSEKVFELNLVFEASIPSYNNHAGANMPWLWNWRNDKMYLPNGKGTEVYKTGWGACNPTEKFIDKLIENDGMDSYRRKAWVKTYDEVLYEMPYASDGDSPVMGKTAFKESDPTRGIWKDDGLYGHCGWFMWKINIRNSDLSNNNRTMQNTRIFRYTEVLFLYMECALQTGKDKDKALKYLNDIQRRAGAKHISSELTMTEIKNEKFLECWLEGLRFLDLVRWGDTAELANNGKSYPSFRDKLFTEGAAKHEGFVDYSDADWCIKLYPNLGFQKGKHEFFPFPFSETSVNENIVQNPGW
ncbi:MAG: RagB/SusD family nutrient uptake outer membrane protein [Bacteroidales bacterium]|nr:RagB/SusD family nutrient uptake outer membrane protein [Bacteroidales bacterium]MBR5073231.1 RagB/SusD family nutrient uptake outer membrane protein [Bacteroidales bacterium]